MSISTKKDITKKYFFLFPIYFFNFFSSSALLLIFYFSKFNYLVADYGLVVSFILFICQILSLNERNILLSENKISKVNSSFIFRVQASFLVIIFSVIFFFSQDLINIFTISVSFLIISQWCFEIFLIKCEIENKSSKISNIILIMMVYVFLILLSIYYNNILLFSILTFFYGLFLLTVCFSSFKRLYLITNFRNFYSKFLKQSILSNKLTSSFFISASNFYFRYFIYILYPKEIAGSVFAFFIFGSFPASIYSTLIAPSIIKDKLKFLRLNIVKIFFLLYLIVGIYLIYLSFFENYSKEITTNLLTAGLSILGSLLMIIAMHSRLKMVHYKIDREICFQMDVIYAVSVICLIPFIYSLNIQNLLSSSFLIISILALFFYKLDFKKVNFKYSIGLIILIFIPIHLILFDHNLNFDLRLYFSVDPFYKSNFNLSTLPIPISFFVIGFIFLILSKKYLIDKELLYILSLMVIFGLSSISLVKTYLKIENIYNLIQFVFPLIAFVLGNEFAKKGKNSYKIFEYIFWIYLSIISFQLIEAVIFRDFVLKSNLYKLGIYNHLQYISVFIAITFLTCINYFLEKNKINFLQAAILCLLTNIYVIFSTSISGLLYTLFLTILLFYLNKRKIFVYSLILFLTIIFFLKFQFDFQKDFIDTVIFKIINFIPLFIERISSTLFYINEISNLREFFFGKNNDFETNPLFDTSFNYYIDFIYNFGIITFLPLLYLILSFIKKFSYNFNYVSNHIIFLGFMILIFILLDTFIKSSLREIFTGNLLFFLWGYTYYFLKSKKNDKV
jgi:hypothetical protein